MKFEALPLQGAFVIHGEPVSDERGSFTRIYCEEQFKRAGLPVVFPQLSISHNLRRGTLRGLHYQPAPQAEIKLVSCVRGRIFDVLVDIREESPTFRRWYGLELSPQAGTAVYIPEGFAHGFVTLEDNSDVHYMITPAHQPGFGKVIRWSDPSIDIQWPVEPVIMSPGDRAAPQLTRS